MDKIQRIIVGTIIFNSGKILIVKRRNRAFYKTSQTNKHIPVSH